MSFPARDNGAPVDADTDTPCRAWRAPIRAGRCDRRARAKQSTAADAGAHRRLIGRPSEINRRRSETLCENLLGYSLKSEFYTITFTLAQKTYTLQHELVSNHCSRNRAGTDGIHSDQQHGAFEDCAGTFGLEGSRRGI